MTLAQAIVAIPGILALLGVAVAWGTLSQKVRTLENQMQHLTLVSETVAKIDERTRYTQAAIAELRGDVRSFTAVLLGEARSFRETTERVAEAIKPQT